jgi:hypothetical protein
MIPMPLQRMRNLAFATAMLLAVGLVASVLSASALTAHAQECNPSEIQRLLPSEAEANDEIGRSLAVRGDTAIIGAVNGAAYVYRDAGGGDWIEVQKLLPSDGPSGDDFGFSIDIDGGVAIIGVIGADGIEPGSGAVYVFREDGGGTWTEVQKIVASDGATRDQFGYSVALSGDTMIIGACWDRDRGDYAGSAYLFRDDGSGTFVELDKIIGSGVGEGHWFGRSVDLCADTAIVGAGEEQWGDAGSAYLFRDDGTGNWEEVERLRASEGYFGHSVALLGRTAVVGAPEDTENGRGAGAAYVFREDGAGDWTEVDKLLPSDGAENHQFGSGKRAIAFVDERTVLIGARKAHGAEEHTGAAYLFHDAGAGDWIEIDKLVSERSTGGDAFGRAVSVDGNVAVIGSPRADEHGIWTGSATVFDLDCGGPSLRALGSCPGPMRFQVEGARPGERVAYLHARNLGAFEVPPGRRCAGTILGLDATVELAAVGIANGNGVTRLDLEHVPPRACGRVHLQAIGLGSCKTTNVVSVE